VLNLEGRVFMKALDCPFRAADRLVQELKDSGVRCILVDMHCEATSEKNALGHYLDGRVSAVLGTHTHIQTADGRVLRGGTAFQTDVGMCGPWDSVIGVRKEAAIERFLTARHVAFEPAQDEPYLQGAIVDIDEETGRARSIVRVQERLPE
jgi:metallophosphoesterase (TIGR00282 family)